MSKVIKKALSGKWLVISILLIIPILSFSGCFQTESPTETSVLVPLTFAEAVEKVMPSVVYIFVEVETGQPGSVRWCEWFRRYPAP